MTAPYALATADNNAAATTLAATVSASTTAGDAVVVAASANGSGFPTGCADSQGNTYVLQSGGVTHGTSYNDTIFVAVAGPGGTGATAALASGTDTITVTYSSAAAVAKNLLAIGAPGATAADVTPAAVTNAGSTSPSISSGALAQAHEVIVAVFSCANQTVTWGGAFASAQVTGGVQFASNQRTAIAALTVSSTSSVTATGTITSAKWAATMVSLKVTIPSVTGTGTAAAHRPAGLASGWMVPSGTGTGAAHKPAGSGSGTFTAPGAASGTATAAVARPSAASAGAASAAGTATAAVPRPAASSAGATAGRNLLIPAPGRALFGGYPGPGNAAPAVLEGPALANRQLDVLVRYENFDGVWPGATDEGYAAGGRTLSSRWAGTLSAGGAAQWADIAAGMYDTVITTKARYWAAWGQPMFVSFCGEFDGGAAQSAYAAALFSADGMYAPAIQAAFTAAWKRIYGIVAPIAPNIIWTWVMTGNQLTAATAGMYPGDAYVDWIGFDKYATSVSTYPTPNAAYGPVVTYIKASISTSKPYGLFETGVPNTGSGGGNSDAACAAWFGEVPSQCAALGIQIWCPWNDGTSAVPLATSATPLQAQALASIGASSFFGSSSGPYPLGSADNNAAATTLAATVSASTTAGDGIVVAASENGSGFPVSCADSKGNTYVLQSGGVTHGTSYNDTVFTALAGPGGTGPTVALDGSIDTITVTYSSAASVAKNLLAIGVPGATSVDVTPAAVTSAGSASPSISSGTLGQASEVVVAVISAANQTVTWGGAFTTAQLIGGVQFASNQRTAIAALTVNSTASVTASGTITSAKWAATMVTLEVNTPVSGTGAAAAAKPGASGTGRAEAEGTGTGPAHRPAAAASGTFTPPGATGTGTGAARRPSAAAAGRMEAGGTGTAAVPRPGSSGTGRATITGTGAGAARRTAATGSVTFTPAAITGTGHGAAGRPSASAAGLVDVSGGTAAASVRQPGAAGSGYARNNSGTLVFRGSPPFTVPRGVTGGVVTLNGTTAVTVAATAVSASSLILLTVQPGTAPAGWPRVASITPGTGFSVKSGSGSDTAVICGWYVVQAV